MFPQVPCVLDFPADPLLESPVCKRDNRYTGGKAVEVFHLLVTWAFGIVVNTPRSVVVIWGAVVQFPTCPTPFMKIPTKMPLSA
jgi:hypothetical protein